MEDDWDNIFQRQRHFVANNNGKVGKPPTRLQKHAPASLVLDHLPTNPIVPEASGSRTPIPLLSPLVLSPQPLPQEEAEQEFVFHNCCGRDTLLPEPGKCQHPAMSAGYMDPSSLFCFFQSKCVLVNHTQ
ncbi:hypothetical protein K2173_015769 [Erythroxylum novogranatense]|uniref:Uncharacterized protein n=1 Tax=Erythroxylum novogranatense TaxID=1862640 RepID=A0AAV8SEF0_9ROSI|nr:hypothetical protein K2173_015769 [Erythroxylum novogranatense]